MIGQSTALKLYPHQPLRAFDHPKYQEMIAIAARSKNGVKIPNRKYTRKRVIDRFTDHLRWLKQHLNVSFLSVLSVLFCVCLRLDYDLYNVWPYFDRVTR